MMVNYTVYDLSTGRIIKSGSCPDGDLPLQFDPATQGVIDRAVMDDQFYLDLSGADPVEVQIPARTSDVHDFNWSTKQWEDQRTLAEVKAVANNRITSRRVEEDMRFEWAGKWFQADSAAWKQITGVHGWVIGQGSLPPGFPGVWKAKDNTYAPIPDVSTWWSFYGTVLARGAANFARGEALKAQLAAATTIAEAEAVPDW
jgi:hypothetical protein